MCEGVPHFIESADDPSVKSHANLASTTAPTPEEEKEDALALQTLFTFHVGVVLPRDASPFPPFESRSLPPGNRGRSPLDDRRERVFEVRSARVRRSPLYPVLSDAARRCRPYERTQNALAEEFKMKLRGAVEARIIQHGGTVQSILREAFLFWDSDASGELNVREFTGAMARVGMALSHEHSQQVVRYYDRKGNRGRFGDGEIHYMDLVDEISKNIPHFISHPVTGREAAPNADVPEYVTVAVPDDVAAHVAEVRRGALNAAPRATLRRGQRLDARDLLHGTLLRVDRAGTGRLDQRALQKALKQLRVGLNDRQVHELVCWYDNNGTNALPYLALVEDAFPKGTTYALAATRSLPRLPASASPSRSAPPTPSTGTPMATSRRKMARINAEKATIERRLRQLQGQQDAAREG